MQSNCNLTYLACPYTHPDPEVVEYRVKEATKLAAHLLIKGQYVFSPLTHGHPISRIADLPNDWEYWQNYCRAFLEHSRSLVVLQLDGWEASVGVQAEIAIAEELSIPVTYISPPYLIVKINK